MTWDEVGRIFRVAVSTASQDAAKLDPADLGSELARDLMELMRTGPKTTTNVVTR